LESGKDKRIQYVGLNGGGRGISHPRPLTRVKRVIKDYLMISYFSIINKSWGPFSLRAQSEVAIVSLEIRLLRI